jgi:membrane associated rhomboid family serine protease
MQQYKPTSFNILPPVVKNLLIINGLFFLATLVLGERFNIDLTEFLGLHFPISEKFRPYQLVTYMFMHGGFTHLFFNMFALWMFGNTLENYWGPKRFLTYYIITGIGAAVCHYTVLYFQMEPTLNLINEYLNNPSLNNFQAFINSEHFKITNHDTFNHATEILNGYNQAADSSDMTEALRISVEYMQIYKADFLNAPVIIGASGSVFGILLAFGMLFPNTMLYIYFAIPIKAKWFVILYGAAELYSGIANSSGDNVAHFAHLGGMLFGFILIKYWQKNSTNFY